MNPTELIGRSLPPAAVVVERGQVAAFAAAVTDTSPVYRRPEAAAEIGLPAIPAPPTFTFAARLLAAFEEPQPPRPQDAAEVGEVIAQLRAEGGMILHAEQEFSYHAPVLVGDVLSATGSVEDVRVTTSKSGKRMTFVRLCSEWRKADGELAVAEVMTLLHRA
ncbi:FAS1-like dehydratase domain-containing protein [Frankia sp. AgKG'84/4]|uniref:FAS1-like dehydratase domain-containing protein n=1 Tax=Frankia sp. AgKG'84/4 TaxID=573490 RepID=UPI00200F8547|nr:MaoC family dehydratase N-terminal domain-containing protein [Frankia sp. AgKG'84/4]MCL9794371.1 MaoC family dehydratase N-terminal domain-containing protein [Frankia sp. AgKG'84/4]